ncbi:sulfotransferase 1B1-like [Dermacentor andersoni]|uniref:sulfotransferase 1B1-like n=1 Tax=Dermacentor andersoni TaxID=34620 RepID=UPI002155259A|nr:sulfotransferase 1B1-like [Dermacentor andersoni]
MSKRKPYAQIIDGIPRSPNCDPDLLRAALEFRAQKGDLVLSTYPKSGTHWMMYIIQLILKEGEPVSSFDEFMHNLRVLGVVEFDTWKPTLPLRLFATHLPLSTTTMNKDAKYVYVARNPWDLCVSSFHMITTFDIYRFRDGTFEELFDAFLEGDCAGQGSYFDHVASGYALRDQPNLFFVTYEELKTDTRSVILRLARFLGDDYGDKLEKQEELMQDIVDRCASENMKHILAPESQGHADRDWYNETERSMSANSRISVENSKQFSYVRKGDVGGWQRYFTRDQLRRLEARIKQLEEHSRVMDLWMDTRAAALKIIANE